MKFKVEIMPQARFELFEAAEFIALDNPQKASEFFEETINNISDTYLYSLSLEQFIKTKYVN